MDSMTQIQFITDVAGDYSHWKKLLVQSEVVSVNEMGALRVAPHGILILGGDMVGGNG